MVARLARPERKAKTREDILAAARRVFFGSGFHGTTLDEIAEEAGYTKGAVYSNFASKDDLFLAVFEDRYSREQDEMQRVLTEEGSSSSGRTPRTIPRRARWPPPGTTAFSTPSPNF